MSYLLFAVGACVAGLTTFYMFRLFFVAFLGEARTEKAKHAHESPAVMTLPLVVLAVFAVIGGCIGITNIYGSQFCPDSETLSVAQQALEPLHNLLPMAAWASARWRSACSPRSHSIKMPRPIRCPPNWAAWPRR